MSCRRWRCAVSLPNDEVLIFIVVDMHWRAVPWVRHHLEHRIGPLGLNGGSAELEALSRRCGTIHRCFDLCVLSSWDLLASLRTRRRVRGHEDFCRFGIHSGSQLLDQHPGTRGHAGKIGEQAGERSHQQIMRGPEGRRCEHQHAQSDFIALHTSKRGERRRQCGEQRQPPLPRHGRRAEK